MPGWELIDRYEPGQEGIPIHCELRLRSELRRLVALKPRLVQLVSTEHEMLVLALFGATALAYWSEGPYLLRNRVVRPSENPGDEPAGLLYRGHQVLVEAEALLPLEDVIEVAAFVYNYGQLPIWVGGCAEAVLPPLFAARADLPKRRNVEGICVLAGHRSHAG